MISSPSPPSQTELEFQPARMKGEPNVGVSPEISIVPSSSKVTSVMMSTGILPSYTTPRGFMISSPLPARTMSTQSAPALAGLLLYGLMTSFPEFPVIIELGIRLPD